jgi:5-oxoprolinase (ATP-hydrolysing)
VQLGELHSRRGDFATAEQHYGEALKLAPEHWSALEHLAEVRGALGGDDEATALFTKAAEKTDRPEIWQALGDWHLFQKRAEPAKLAHDLALAGYRASIDRGEVLYVHHLAGFYCDSQENAEEAVRRVVGALSDGRFEYAMDSGAVIRVAIAVDRAARSATIDFTGTSAQQPTNFNAPAAVCKAAVLYVFRTLVDDDIPMNAGCLKPLTIVIPDGSMLRPRYPAAVVAGNVETSQTVTDTLYGALGVLAASQGTMNNFTFGNATYQYYETIAGGAGAGPDFDGASVVQTHMTNSRLTDPEVLEWRFPVRLESFSIRRGSGGDGAHRGGDGAVRRVRFLEPMTAVMLANHRTVAPFGVAGGNPGAVGRNWVERSNGSREEFGATFQVEMNHDDVFVIETPGGGGYGPAA